MSKLKRVCALVFFSILIVSINPAFLYAMDNEDVAGIFCEDMKNPDLYDKNRFESYKMLIPGKQGWIFRTETDLKSDFRLTRDGLDNMRDLNQVLKARGIELVIFMTPTRGLMHGDMILPGDREKYQFTDIDKAWASYWAAIEDLRREGLAVVGLEKSKAKENFFYKRDHHWNSYGAKISAEILADYIRKMPDYSAIEKISFVPKVGEESEFSGVSKKVFKKFCKTNQPSEKIIKKFSERAEENNDQEDLFGDVKNPEIVLLGTSNSTQEPSFANFEGFLKEALSADILNMSVSGGGLDTAMLAYFNSDYYKTAPAKIAIWEIPSYYDISNHTKFFREAIPAAYNGCSHVAAESPGVLLDDKTTIALSKLGEKKIAGNSYYLYLNFSKPVSKAFNVDFLYPKNRDKYRFYHSNRYPSDREFYLRLEDQKESYLDKVSIIVPREMIGQSVDVKICQQPRPEMSFFAKK